VVSSWLTAHAAMPDTGTLAGDLQAYATGVADDIRGPRGLAVLRLLIALSAGGDPALRARDTFVAARRTQLETMLDRAAARGEHPPDPLSVIDFVLAPLYVRVLFGIPLTPNDIRTQVTRLLADAEAPGNSASLRTPASTRGTDSTPESGS
jgi:hypothetical protein